MAAVAEPNHQVKLLGSWASPFVARARVALNLKDVAYQFVQEDLQNKSELLRASNPVHKKVPVLIHNGLPICESLVILQYIDEVWPAGNGVAAILPSDPYERATARFWAAYIDDKVAPLGRRYMAAGTEQERGEISEEIAVVFANLDEAFGMCSQGKAFFGGDSIGYVDIALGSVLLSLKAFLKLHGITLFSETNTSRLAEWSKRYWTVDAVKVVTPDLDKLADFYATRFAAPPAAKKQN